MQRRLGLDLEIPDDFGHWLAGFTDGEGYFGASISESHGSKVLNPTFAIRLRADDQPILNQIQDTLKVGRIYHRPARAPTKPSVDYHVHRLADLYHVIIPLFEKYPLRAKKAAEFQIWKELVTLHFHAMHDRGGGHGRGSYPHPRAFWEKVECLVQQLKQERKYNQ